MQNQEASEYKPFDWDKYNREAAVQNERYRILSEEIKNTQESSSEVLKSVATTLQLSQDAIKSAQQTQVNLDNYQKQFSAVFDQIHAKLAQSLQPDIGIKATDKSQITAKLASIQECQRLINNKKVLILSGAGLSAASGIPTFRGNGGFWTSGTDTLECQKVLTLNFFKDQPEKCWDWHKDFQNTISNKKPNSGHLAIAKYQKNNPQTILVTQNIDDLLTSCLQQSYRQPGINNNIFEIHGNIKYMRCVAECKGSQQLTLYKMPDLNKVKMPTCPDCKGEARPHILFFDEFYTQKISQNETILSQLESAEVLIVVGTMLETGLSASMIRQSIKQNKTIIEINIDTVIETGTSTYTLKGKAEDILPKLLS